jgi:hypothetical protein
MGASLAAYTASGKVDAAFFRGMAAQFGGLGSSQAFASRQHTRCRKSAAIISIVDSAFLELFHTPLFKAAHITGPLRPWTTNTANSHPCRPMTLTAMLLSDMIIAWLGVAFQPICIDCD